MINFEETPGKKDLFMEIQKENRSFSPVFVGFKNIRGSKKIEINESKLKKARQFFDDSQEDDYDANYTVGFMAAKPKSPLIYGNS